MRLVYKTTGDPVKVGDVIPSLGIVMFFREPHKPSSEGKVTLRINRVSCQEYYVSVIGAHWIEREDRGEGINAPI